MDIKTAAATVITLTIVMTGITVALTNRYQIGRPFTPALFARFDRWTGKVESCSSIYDDTTYCGKELSQRSQAALDAEHEFAHLAFLKYGYTEDQIIHWPPDVLEMAQNIIGNGGDKAALDAMIHQYVRR